MNERSIFAALVRSLLGVAALVVAAWLVLGLFGIDFALWSSLGLSLLLTAVLTLGMNAFRSSNA